MALTKVTWNMVFSTSGTGLLGPFRKKENTVDVSNQHELTSMGARLQVC